MVVGVGVCGGVCLLCGGGGVGGGVCCWCWIRWRFGFWEIGGWVFLYFVNIIDFCYCRVFCVGESVE